MPREDPIRMLEDRMKAAKKRGQALGAIKKRPVKERDDSLSAEEAEEGEASSAKTKSAGEASSAKKQSASKPGPPTKKAKSADSGPGGPKAAEAVVKDVLNENAERLGRKGWNKDKLQLKAYNQVKGRLGSKVEGINSSGG